MEDRSRLAKHWPFFGLSVRTARLELRYPTDADLAALADLAGDVHDPEFMPFQVPWTTRPEGERERGLLQYHWHNRADWSVDEWRIELVTVVEGEIVGVQGLFGSKFAVRRTAETGSWLARVHQGRGIGKEMRLAMLHLAFDGLGASRTETGAFDDNGPSLGVTRHLGYAPNGALWHDRLGSQARELAVRDGPRGLRGHPARRRRDLRIRLRACPCSGWETTTPLARVTRPRVVAQLGRALRSGRRGREFKSPPPDKTSSQPPSATGSGIQTSLRERPMCAYARVRSRSVRRARETGR